MEKIASHDIEYLRSVLTPLNPYDKSDAINSIKDQDLLAILGEIYDILEPETLLGLTHQKKKIFIEEVGIEKIANNLLRVENDDIVGFISDVKDEYRYEILHYIPRLQRKSLQLALTYTKDQVGRLMDTDFLTFTKDSSVADAKNRLAESGNDLSLDTRDIFVVDDEQMLIGTVNVFLLFTASNDSPLMSILKDDFKTVNDVDDKAEVAYIFNKYSLTSLPVVDREGAMIGFISSDIAMEVTTDEGHEDILRLGGGVVIDDDEGIIKRIYTRFIWLFVNLNMAFISSSVISKFEGIIGKYSFLAALFPIVASIGGNSGMQTITLTVRMIALKSLTDLNRSVIFLREIFISVVNSVMFIVITFMFSYLMYGNVAISSIFALAIFANICISTILGLFIPLIMRKLGTDPAITSSIFLTTATDCIGFGIFLSLVTIFFK